MAKVPEPQSKLEILHSNIIAELVQAGIINKEMRVLDEAALEAYFDNKIKELKKQLDETVTEWGEVKDQYAYNMLGSEIELMVKMATQKTLTPESESPYPEEHKIRKYFETQQVEKKKETAKRRGIFRWFRCRDK
jgi:uncharacterized membrane protein YheB (UPF0754 family)